LGLPPPDLVFDPASPAGRVRDRAADLAARALTVAIDRDASFAALYDDVALRARLHDATLLADRLATALAAADPSILSDYADQTVPVYRRKKIPLDHMIDLCEGLKTALPVALSERELPAANEALDSAIAVYRNQRRIAGDARKRNRFIQFIYKGA
jgi:hypothetical protein